MMHARDNLLSFSHFDLLLPSVRELEEMGL